MEPNANNYKRILVLPGDLLKLTISVKTPAYLNINFDDVPVDERTYQLDICYGDMCD